MEKLSKFMGIICILSIVIVFSFTESVAATLEIHHGETIQKQIDALPPEGGIVNIPSGVYELSSPLVIPSNVTLMGSGFTTILKPSAAFPGGGRYPKGVKGKDMVINSDIEKGNVNIIIKNLKLDADNRVNQLLLLQRVDNFLIEGCWFYNPQVDTRGGIRIKSTNGRIIGNIFERPHILNVTDYASNVVITGNTFKAGWDSSISIGCGGRRQMKNFVVANNIFTQPEPPRSAQAVDIFGDVSDVVIANNVIDGVGKNKNAIWIHGEAPEGQESRVWPKRVIVTGNIIRNVNRGINIHSNAEDVLILGNRIDTVKNEGIRNFDATSQIVANRISNTACAIRTNPESVNNIIALNDFSIGNRTILDLRGKGDMLLKNNRSSIQVKNESHEENRTRNEAKGFLELKENEIQLVEGFSEIVSYTNTQDLYPDYRGGSKAWWVRATTPDKELSWRTAPCSKKEKTVFAFIGGNGEGGGKVKLYVNGEYALTFDTGIAENKKWKEGQYELGFLFKTYTSGNNGVYFFTVPEEEITPGKPCTIKAKYILGEDSSWFMVFNYQDVIHYEQIKTDDS